MEEFVRKLVREQLEQVFNENEFQEIEFDVDKISEFKHLEDVISYLSRLYRISTGVKSSYIRVNIDGTGTGHPVKNPVLFADILQTHIDNEELMDKSLGKAPITNVAYVTINFRDASVNFAVSGI